MYYTNNPVIATVTTTRLTVEEGHTLAFHRVIVSVGGIELTTLVGEEATSLTIDISSALRALADALEYAYTDLAGKTVTAVVTAREEYVYDNVRTSRVTTVSIPDGTLTAGTLSVTATVGGLSDRERLAGVDSKTTNKPCALASTNKSFSPQIACKDETVVIGGVETPSTASDKTAGGKIYRIGDNLADVEDRYLLRFVNRYGCMESIGVSSYRESEMNITSETYNVARPETKTQFSRARMSKKNDYETWKLSSGPLTRAWQQWFAHELLMATDVWMYVGGIWQRVHIESEDTVTLVNRSSGDMLEVQFSVRFDINGDPEF